MVTAIILAGGLGTRLRSAVPDLPKPMAPLDGRPFLEYQMDYWLDQGVKDFVLSVGYKRELIEQHFGSSYRGAKLGYAIEAEPLGTGGAVLLALAGVRTAGPWLVLNGDTFFDVSLTGLMKFHDDKRSQITLSLLPVQDNARYTGVEVDEGQRITRLGTSRGGARQLINGGVTVLSDDALADLPYRAGDRASFELDVLERALEAGKRLYGYIVGSKRFVDIGVPEDYARAAACLRG